MPPIYMRGPLRAPEGEPSGGGAPSDDKKFSQGDLDRVAAQVRRETEAKFKDFDAIKTKASQVDELSVELTKLKDQLELKDKDSAEQQRILAERARKQSESEILSLKQQVGELTTARDGASTRLRQFQIQTTAGAALHAAGVLQSAHGDALTSLLGSTEIELDEKGGIASVKYDGVPQKDLSAAATAFLASKPHFKAAKPGGGGTTPPNGGALTTERLQSLSPEEALAAGMRARPVRPQAGDQWDEPQS